MGFHDQLVLRLRVAVLALGEIMFLGVYFCTSYTTGLACRIFDSWATGCNGRFGTLLK